MALCRSFQMLSFIIRLVISASKGVSVVVFNSQGRASQAVVQFTFSELCS